MDGERESEIWNSLPNDLKNSRYEYRGEYAWAREDALRVIEALEKKDAAVIGVDVWLPTTPAPTIPTPFVYDLDASAKSHGESWRDFARRTGAHSAKFVREFGWDPQDSTYLHSVPYFNLTVLMTDD